MSATFGGAQTMSDINGLVANSIFMQTHKQTTSRKLEITVVGKLSTQDIIDRAAEEA